MSFYHDKQIKIYGCFLAVFGFLIAGAGLLFYLYQTNSVKMMCLLHDEAVISSLLEQGVSRDIIAAAITNTHISIAGEELSAAVPYCWPWFFSSEHCCFSGSGNDYMSGQKQSFRITSTGTIPAICRKTARGQFFSYSDRLNSLLQCCKQKMKQSITQKNF